MRASPRRGPERTERMAGRDLKGLAAAQEAQARRVVARDDFDPRDVRVVAGGDVTFLHVRRNPTVGLAAFVLLLLRAYERVKGRADLYLLDGQGIAHPRGLGIAASFGVETGEVTVGCAKSRLYGSYEEPGPEAGAAAPVRVAGPSRRRFHRSGFGEAVSGEAGTRRLPVVLTSARQDHTIQPGQVACGNAGLSRLGQARAG